MLCRLKTATVLGVNAIPVDVEVDISSGLPGFHLVGLPVGAVREGSVRIRAALLNSGFRLGSVKVTVNLAPADVRKEGSAFDLPIAAGVLGARRLLAVSRSDLLIAGEVALDGQVKPIRGALLLAEAAKRHGLSGIILPRDNAAEAALVPGVEIYGVETLRQTADILAGGGESTRSTEPPPPLEEPSRWAMDFADVCGQEQARQAAEIAAAGGHNLMLVGPPGSGKSMIARCLGSILPPLTQEETIQTTKIYSVAGLLNGRYLIKERPFRAPHHTCSGAGLVGGGSMPRPGEVSLAHHGVLFLDELPEFQRATLEALRQPLEDRQVTIVRSQHAVTYPAAFMLVAAMNPCPCGYRGSAQRTCTCGSKEARRYMSRISGPLLDRFDLFVHVEQARMHDLIEAAPAEDSDSIRRRVIQARGKQEHRFRRSAIFCNAQMSNRQLKHHVRLSSPTKQLLTQYAAAHQMSGRSLYRAYRVARTIADLEEQAQVTDQHILAALTLQQARWVQ